MGMVNLSVHKRAVPQSQWLQLNLIQFLVMSSPPPLISRALTRCSSSPLLLTPTMKFPNLLGQSLLMLKPLRTLRRLTWRRLVLWSSLDSLPSNPQQKRILFLSFQREPPTTLSPNWILPRSKLLLLLTTWIPWFVKALTSSLPEYLLSKKILPSLLKLQRILPFLISSLPRSMWLASVSPRSP